MANPPAVRVSKIVSGRAAMNAGIAVNKSDLTGLADGDILYIFYYCNLSSATPWTLSGFTNLVHTNSATGNDVCGGILRKVITSASGEPSTYTPVGASSSSANIVLDAVVVKNADTTTPESVTAVATAGANDATPLSQALTINRNNSLVLTACGLSQNNAAAAKTAGAPLGCTLIDSKTETGSGTGFVSFLQTAQKIESATSYAAAAWTTTADDATSEYVVMSVAVSNKAPSVTQDTADAVSVGSVTPTLLFTGTDFNVDDVRYEVLITSSPLDSYSEVNQDASTAIYDATHAGTAQAFHGVAKVLNAAKFYLQKISSPTGNMVAKLYAHDGGTFGSGGAPTGAAIATSNTVAASSVGTSYGLVKFTFPSPPTLAAGTDYFIAIEYSAGDAANLINVGMDLVGPTHAGNQAKLASGTWSNSSGDLCFYLLADDISLDKVSGTDAGFADVTNGADTDPFTSGDQVGLTVQVGDGLVNGNVYRWQVQAKDPNGSNVYGTVTALRTFTVAVVPPLNRPRSQAVPRAATR